MLSSNSDLIDSQASRDHNKRHTYDLKIEDTKTKPNKSDVNNANVFANWKNE
jgi:hypothetical protein